MKNRLLRAAGVCLAAILLISAAVPGRLSGSGMFSASAASKTWQTGDIGYMGKYPQTQVTDTTLISELNSAVRSEDWVSYGYYSGDDIEGASSVGDWMKYADIIYDNIKYRGVTISQYRFSYANNRPYGGYTIGPKDNGYNIGTTYWFRYDPVAWQVLDPGSGLVISHSLLDAQPYNNVGFCEGEGSETYLTPGGGDYADNYQTSSIRSWLNDTFLGTVFTSDEQAAVKTTSLDNSDPYDSRYDGAGTSDKIFLPGYTDVKNSAYGFTDNNSRFAFGTEYAKCQGLFVYHDEGKAYALCSDWFLRNPGWESGVSCGVYYDGSMDMDAYFFYCSCTSIGIRPAMCVDLQSGTFQADGVSVTLSRPAAATASATSAASDSTAATTAQVSAENISSGTDTGSRAWLWIVIAASALILIALIVIIVALIKRKSSRPGGPGPRGGGPGGYYPQGQMNTGGVNHPGGGRSFPPGGNIPGGYQNPGGYSGRP